MKFIDNVKVEKLEIVTDELGWSLQISDDAFKPIQTIVNRKDAIRGYYVCNYNVNIVCICGMIKLILFDMNEDSATKYDTNEFFIGEREPFLISIPPFVAFAWKCISDVGSNVVLTMKNYKQIIDPFSEDLQTEQIGFPIPYKF